METWVIRSIRTKSRTGVAAWGLALACVVLVAISQHRYIDGFLNGPFDLGATELDAVNGVAGAPHSFARVTGSKTIDTGIRLYEVHKTAGHVTGRKETAAYYALAVGDRFLVVKSRVGAATTVVGGLKAMEADLDGQLFDSPEMEGLRSRFYPFYLDDASYRTPGYVALAAFGVFAIVLIRKGGRAWRFWRDPAAHPAARRLATWGDAIGIARDAEQEARTPRFRSDGWRLTDKYLIRSTAFSFDLLRLADLLWAYKHVTKRSINFIPAGKSYKAILACRGGTASVSGTQKSVDDILAFAHFRAPWAATGFSPDIANEFQRNFEGFVAAVERRKREHATADAPAS